MIRLIQRRLIIPRGDTGTFTIPVVASNNTGDVAVFTIFSEMTKKKIYEKIVAIDSDTITVEFAHGDTVNLPVGKYVWDIKFYKNPVFVDDVLVNGDEIDSYYAAFTLPVCEIRQTGDTLLTADDAPTATIAPEYLNIVNAAISETLHNKNLAAESAAAAETSAANASSYLADTLAAKDVAEARVNEIENLSVEVNTGVEGSDASVTYTPATGVLSFEIPRGDTGNGIASCTLNADFTLTINYTDGTSLTTIPIRGDTPHLTIGEVTEGPNAIATITGTDANPILNLTLPNANVPTRVSQLENDSNYAVDSNYVHTDNNYTTAEKEKLAGIAAGAQVNVKADWTATSGDAQILNKPTNVSAFTNDAGYLTQHQDISGKANSADLAAVATSGSYDDLSDKPIIPDVQINGTSIVESGVANIPVASTNNLGIAKVGDLGITISYMSGSEGVLAISSATYNDIKASSGHFKAITPSTQNRAVFYGLAKAAGDTTQSQSANAVGTYTAEAKSAIQTMLDVPSNASVASQISTAIGNINSFDLSVVQSLPSQDISTHTIYLVPKTGETNDVYDEYVYINSNWEMVGNTQVDLSNYVQKTDYATGDNAGVVKVNDDGTYGIRMLNGQLAIKPPANTAIKNGTSGNQPLTPLNQHESTFYGLAKAAGDSTQSQSSNAVGQYTDEAKAAIQTMLDVPAKGDIPEVPVQDVQVNGVSVLSDGVANVPLAKERAETGVVKVNSSFGITEILGNLILVETSIAEAKTGTSQYRAILPSIQHASAFYGLAKAAGADMKDIANTTVGTYPDAQKEAIQSMLGITQMLAPANPNLVASQAYAIGDVFAANGHLYKATTAIAQDGAIIPDMNCVETTMAEAGGKIKDVQVNGTSIVNNGVANISKAGSGSGGALGVVTSNSSYGTTINSVGAVIIAKATDADMKTGIGQYRPVTPYTQHMSVFYGLSKLAGVDLANETVTLGTYPETSKTAIKEMLGVQDGLKVVRLI